MEAKQKRTNTSRQTRATKEQTEQLRRKAESTGRNVGLVGLNELRHEVLNVLGGHCYTDAGRSVESSRALALLEVLEAGCGVITKGGG